MQKKKTKHIHEHLGELASTAICGNDILSSSLYVSGIAAIYAGVFAPIVLLIVGLVLFFYRGVYREVVEALPINGGAYNCLLNATSKTMASLAGIMTILSYIATAVISAKVAIEYLHFALPSLPVLPATIALLFAFAVLVILGVKDSAKVALVIFITHIISLVGFVFLGIWFIFSGQSVYGVNVLATGDILKHSGGLLPALALAFSASLLGISGFESSANFVEEQKPGVFAKTLRNMWAGVSIFNPLIAFVVISSMSMTAIAGAKDFLLADAARIIGGSIFGYVIVVDAFLVLSGAVLTAYVGVTGLIYRMTLDGVLPEFLLGQNSRGSHSKIILAFFALCASILLVTRGELLSLAGVYTISFLGVMSLFALGNLILRETRTDLKRPYQAPLVFVVLAFLATASGIVGNILINERNLFYFGTYFVPFISVAFVMIYKDRVLSVWLWLIRPFPKLYTYFKNRVTDILDGHFVVFVHHPTRLFNALSYIDRNEVGRHITIVHCDNKTHPGHDHDYDASYKKIRSLLPQMQEAGVFPHFKLDFLYKRQPFSPELIEEIAQELKIRKNRIFIGSIHHEHEFDYADLGGVRIISG